MNRNTIRVHRLGTRRLVVVLLAIHIGIVGFGAIIHSFGWDEVGHMVAGISHWRSGRFDLYRVNPPLVRLVATLPLVFAGEDINWSLYDASPEERGHLKVGADFIAAHGAESLRDLALARLACLPFSVLGALVCFTWARRLYGDRAGLAAMALWCTSPTVLANAQMITPDTAAGALGVAAAYRFWCWLETPGPFRALSAGVLPGLALLAKFTLLLFIPLWSVLWLRQALLRPQRSLREHARGASEPAIILAAALMVIEFGYAFEGIFTPLGDFPFMSRVLTREAGEGSTERVNRFSGTWAASLPVPLPFNMVEGIDVQKADFEKGRWSYMRGEWKHGGWWYYYLYGFAVKEPIGTIGLGIMASFHLLMRRRTRRVRSADWLLLSTPVAILMLVSSQTGFSHHYRYVFPALPFYYIAVSRVFSARGRRSANRSVRVLAVGLLSWSMASSLWYVPHSLTYFNELAGGPSAGPWHLNNSNVDWGMDLILLERWLDAHPEARPMQIIFWSCYLPETLRIWDEHTTCDEFPAMPAPGAKDASPRWYAITVSRLTDRIGPNRRDPLATFRHRKPYARVGYTILIFKVE